MIDAIMLVFPLPDWPYTTIGGRSSPKEAEFITFVQSRQLDIFLITVGYIGNEGFFPNEMRSSFFHKVCVVKHLRKESI